MVRHGLGEWGVGYGMNSLKKENSFLDRKAWRLFQALARFSLGLEGPEAVQAAAEGVDGRGLLSLVKGEGLASFFLWGIRESGALSFLTPPFVEALEEIAAWERDYLVRVSLVAVQAFQALEDLQIPYLVVKGLALASYWPGPMQRFMSDVDILVPWEERNHLWAHYDRFRRIQADLGITAEVEPFHHDLSAGDTIPVDFDKLFERSRPSRVAGREVRVPSPLDLALGSASSALRHDPRSLRLLLDLAFLVRSGELDLGVLAGEGRKLGLDRVLRFLFLEIQARFGLEADARILSLARESGVERRLGLPDGNGVPRPGWFAGPGLSRSFLKVRLEGLSRFLKRSVANFFPPPRALRNQFMRDGIQGRFLPLLYLEHWRRRLRFLVPRRVGH